MSFSDHKIEAFTHKISDLPDQPNMQPEELKAHFDSSPEELRQALNALCDALAAQTAAADIGFAQTAGVPETTVQEAIENVQAQVTEAIIGSIPSGSITGDKLAQDVRDRFSAIESAASGEASTRASADSSMQSQISALSTTKCEVYCGFYTGDGTENRTISLSKTPRAVLVMTNGGEMYLANSNATYGGLAVTDSPVIYQYDYQQAVKIVSNGFEVTIGGSYNCLKTNVSGTIYHYIALV